MKRVELPSFVSDVPLISRRQQAIRILAAHQSNKLACVFALL